MASIISTVLTGNAIISVLGSKRRIGKITIAQTTELKKKFFLPIGLWGLNLSLTNRTMFTAVMLGTVTLPSRHEQATKVLDELRNYLKIHSELPLFTYLS